MSQYKNRRVILIDSAKALPKTELLSAIEDDAPVPSCGVLHLQNIYVTADPGMKGWISNAKNYASVETGATMSSFGVGIVINSNNPNFVIGEFIAMNTGWQEYSILNPETSTYRKVNIDNGPLSASLGLLGHSGFTAYFGLLHVGQPKSGETVLVSTAAGSVGSAVGQFAKIKGCKTVGLTGSDEKVELCVNEFGYDHAINYKGTDQLINEIAKCCPNGIDVYYDNVGGDTLDSVLSLMNQNGRVVICGTAATEGWNPPPKGLRFERNVLVNRLRIQGFILFDYRDKYEEALKDIYDWYSKGMLNYREDIAEGLENAPQALCNLYSGLNKGRQLIRVSKDPTI